MSDAIAPIADAPQAPIADAPQAPALPVSSPPPTTATAAAPPQQPPDVFVPSSDLQEDPLTDQATPEQDQLMQAMSNAQRPPTSSLDAQRQANEVREAKNAVEQRQDDDRKAKAAVGHIGNTLQQVRDLPQSLQTNTDRIPGMDRLTERRETLQQRADQMKQEGSSDKEVESLNTDADATRQDGITLANRIQEAQRDVSGAPPSRRRRWALASPRNATFDSLHAFAAQNGDARH